MLRSLAYALAMYSRIPVPSSWFGGGAGSGREEAGWSICFFPLVGAVIGVLQCAVFEAGNMLSAHFAISPLLIPALMTVLPLYVTGGIHFDGFLDTWDARSSFRDREEMLRILKDPHCGAFAVMHGCALFVLRFAFFPMLSSRGVRALGAGYVLSRALSGFCLLWLPKAKRDGMLYEEASSQAPSARGIMAAECAAAALAAVLLSPTAGAAVVLAGFLTLIRYRRMAVGEFGGTTGDLAGWFLTTCELWMLAGTAAACLLCGG